MNTTYEEGRSVEHNAAVTAQDGMAQDGAPKRPDTKRKTRKRVHYTSIPDAGLLAVPSDYSRRVHMPLKQTDFSEEPTGQAAWLRYNADNYDRAARKMRERADLVERYGGLDAYRKVQQIQKKREMLAKLEAELAEIKARHG
jgi:hypothetical protein